MPCLHVVPSDAGLQLQLQRATGNAARAELLITDSPRASAAPSRFLAARLGGSGGARGSGRGSDLECGVAVYAFETEAVVRCGAWHLLTLACRRGNALSLGGLSFASRCDEAILVIDGARAAWAPNFRYPALTTERASHGHATAGAPATTRTPSAALRGQLGPQVVFDTALSPAEVEGCYDAARQGRTLYEHPRMIATWHPLVADRSDGTCVAATTEGPWVARPRSESISVIEMVRARDSTGGILNLLLPLLCLQHHALASGDGVLSAALRMLALAFRGHPRNQYEMIRSDGMLLLGHLLRCICPANCGEASIAALALLVEASRECAELYRQTLDKVILRFDVWRRLERSPQAAVLALIAALASSDEIAAHAVALPQRLLDAGRTHFMSSNFTTRLGGKGERSETPPEMDTLHPMCLCAPALLASDRLALGHAVPLVAHAVALGARCKDVELDAQAATLALLLKLTDVHGGLILEPLLAYRGLLALVELLHRRHSPQITILAARLVCAPLSLLRSGPPQVALAQQWQQWMQAQGFACVRLALGALPADEALFSSLSAILLGCREDEIEMNVTPVIEMNTAQLLPAFFMACARAPQALQVKQLARLSLWLRLCPKNCAALTATASLWQPHAAAMLAPALDVPPAKSVHHSMSAERELRPGDWESMGCGGESLAGTSLYATYLIELLCTYAIESLSAELDDLHESGQAQRTGLHGWTALDVALVVTQGCGDPRRVQYARRWLLHRLLSSMVRLGARFANDARVAAPRLLRLCVVVRSHILRAPTPSASVAATLAVTGNAPGRMVQLQLHVQSLCTTSTTSKLTHTRSVDIWRSQEKYSGRSMALGDATLLLQLCEAFDALSVRAMMDDATDLALRRRSASSDACHSNTSLGLSTRAGTDFSSSTFSMQGIAGSIAGRLKGLTINSGATPPRPSNPVMPPAAIYGPQTDAGSATQNDNTEALSVFDVLLELLLHLAQVPQDTLPAADTQKVKGTTAQRLRELLWRDLEQGCTWAHLSSTDGRRSGGDDDSFWRQRRSHVFALIVALAAPLRDHAVAIQGGRETYNPTLAELLVPLLQGVLRTYRHFLALELAPLGVPGPGSPVSAAAYGLQTVLVGQLGGVETPVWMSATSEPLWFVCNALPHWEVLLETPPIDVALKAFFHAARCRSAHANCTIDRWAQVAEFGWASAATQEEAQASSAAAAADGCLERVQRMEQLRRAAAADRDSAAIAHAAHAWDAMQQSLQREQDAWTAPGTSASQAPFWQHLEVEDVRRRRPLLAPNPGGSDHRKANTVQRRSGGSAAPGSVAGGGSDCEKHNGERDTLTEQLKRVASLARQASVSSAARGGGELSRGGAVVKVGRKKMRTKRRLREKSVRQPASMAWAVTWLVNLLCNPGMESKKPICMSWVAQKAVQMRPFSKASAGSSGEAVSFPESFASPVQASVSKSQPRLTQVRAKMAGCEPTLSTVPGLAAVAAWPRPLPQALVRGQCKTYAKCRSGGTCSCTQRSKYSLDAQLSSLTSKPSGNGRLHAEH